MKTLKLPKKNKKDPFQYDERPEMSFSESDLPQVKQWNLKSEYYLTLKVKMIGTRIEDFGPNKGKVIGRFKVVGVEVEEKE